jgi:hypothetical protein
VGGALGGLLSDTAKKLVAQGYKFITQSDAQKELEAALKRNQVMFKTLTIDNK